MFNAYKSYGPVCYPEFLNEGYVIYDVFQTEMNSPLYKHVLKDIDTILAVYFEKYKHLASISRPRIVKSIFIVELKHVFIAV